MARRRPEGPERKYWTPIGGGQWKFQQWKYDRDHPPQLTVKHALTIYEPGIHAMRVDPPAGVCRRRLLWTRTATPVAVAQDSHGFVALHAGGMVSDNTVAHMAEVGYASPPPFVSIRSQVTRHPLSAVVGVARLTKAPDIRRQGDPWSPWRIGTTGSERLYALTDLRWLNNPVPASGSPGFWPLEKDAARRIATELEGLLPKITRRGRALFYIQDGQLHRGTMRPEGAEIVDAPELDRVRVRLSNGQVVLASEAVLEAGDDISLEIYE